MALGLRANLRPIGDALGQGSDPRCGFCGGPGLWRRRAGAEDGGARAMAWMEML